ncbi:MAG TPA: HD domain-containing protein [Candidatus Moranbacteria bacterium]|nr:HD domain-containing protein [Candidatus Moranbacteria bacterium]
MLKQKIPQTVLIAIKRLEAADFEVFAVGGCVRDSLRKDGIPQDWDLTTNARPEQILQVFLEGKYENSFGTVLVAEKYLAEGQIDLKTVGSSFKIGQKAKDDLVKRAREILESIKDPIHGLAHTEEVWLNAKRIAESNPAVNINYLELICYFHDLGWKKGIPAEHIDEPLRIAKAETANILNKEEQKIFLEGVEHKTSNKSKTIEQQILLEADIIAGISVDRCQKAQQYKINAHLQWVKETFNNKDIYLKIKTLSGKKLLIKAIDNFNRADFGFKLPLLQKQEPEPIKLEEIEDGGAELFAEGIAGKGIIEITTYRLESNYKDKRHPEKIKFAKTLKEDLSRRDFTVNAMALKINSTSLQLLGAKKDEKIKNNQEEKSIDYEIVDLFGGRDDLEKKLIRAVGNPEERFNEDALRLMRAVRFATQLGFKIEDETLAAIKKLSNNLRFISQERIRDELIKIVLSDRPAEGMRLLFETGLMKNIIPELYETVGVKQNRHHYYGPYNTVLAHLLASLEKCPSDKLEVRLAAFFHDLGKPRSKRGEGEFATFHGHEYISARLTKRILERLKFSRAVIKKTVLLVENHMFYYNVDEVGEKGVRKVVRKVGLENIKDLIDVRIGDRLGSGVAKAVPYKLRHFQYMVDKVSADPISVGQLKLDGNDLIKDLKMKPGPKIGAILETLLAKVLDDPSLNTKEQLFELAKKLNKKDIKELTGVKRQAKQKIERKKAKEDQKKKQKHWVR